MVIMKGDSWLIMGSKTEMFTEVSRDGDLMVSELLRS